MGAEGKNLKIIKREVSMRIFTIAIKSAFFMAQSTHVV